MGVHANVRDRASTVTKPTRPPSHDACPAVGRRGVDEVDAEGDDLVNEPRRLLLGEPGLEAEPAEAASAGAGDRDAKAFVRPRVVECIIGPPIK
jgi:hypothetical protein